MDLNQLHDLKSRFVARQVGDELVLVPLTGSIARMTEMFTLNATASFLWESIKADSSVDQLETLLQEHFEVSPEIAHRDVTAFLERLEKLLVK